MAITQIYGIKNCDTVRKARKWLEQSNIEYIFHDIRSDQFNKEVLKKWLLKSKVEAIINKRSATWRGLSLKVQKEFLEEKNTDLLFKLPIIIKRPILDVDDTIYVGFTADKYKSIFFSKIL
ncbi:MAG: Spx/MgsR family RNA polymerase-binding regulatory protein [Cellvibrionales bacterium]|jgi:arsenate reductase (glutaredoxin)|nr:Spx/MgsR family RNA polymerase-binding regulatory protein [Cellvibrionales bacterium]MBT7437247.1 Spx/MgsR family RNA polymerase-binding regulatory protein [Cellvibrionales bacterium]|tara:strand:+ start:18 stop:380 length:363 start_codon:yes stop_codon:yes gene_type:complete